MIRFVLNLFNATTVIIRCPEVVERVTDLLSPVEGLIHSRKIILELHNFHDSVFQSRVYNFSCKLSKCVETNHYHLQSCSNEETAAQINPENSNEVTDISLIDFEYEVNSIVAVNSESNGTSIWISKVIEVIHT